MTSHHDAFVQNESFNECEASPERKTSFYVSIIRDLRMCERGRELLDVFELLFRFAKAAAKGSSALFLPRGNAVSMSGFTFAKESAAFCTVACLVRLRGDIAL